MFCLLVNCFETNSADILAHKEIFSVMGAKFSDLNICLWFDQSKDIFGSHKNTIDTLLPTKDIDSGIYNLNNP